MKKSAIISIAMCALLLTACGSSSKSSDTSAAMNGYSYYDEAGGSYAAEDYDYDDSVQLASPAETAAAGVSSGLSDGDSDSGLSADSVNKEMLVYSCTISIDVLDFKNALDTFKASLDSYGGFIESENYSDGGYSGRYYYADSEKWQTYTATVRVPSKNYDAFCNSAAQLGDLRSKDADVQNLSREYSDLATTLEIYEAKEARYIALLADITDDEYAVAIERELTDVQIQIANIKTRMNEIQTDVAYSYVYITINEVKEYTAEPVKTDTFFERLSATVSDAASGFLDFLETLLYIIIYLFPYLVLIGGIVVGIVAIVKASKKRKAKKLAEKAEQTAQQENKDAPKE